MNTLFIDTHEKEIILAIYKEEKLYKIKQVSDARDHSTVCVPALVELLEESNLNIHDITDIVVVIGPGSFTGVRLGVTIAKTLAYTLNIEIRNMTSLEILLPLREESSYLAIPEKNGYFVAKIEKNNINDYNYLTKEEYQELKKTEKISENLKVSYEEVIKEAHKKKAMNPHEVNPFYVKKIEVEK